VFGDEDTPAALEDIYLSQDFKTSGTWGYQPVNFLGLVQLYIDYIRPETDSQYLFVTFTGEQVAPGYANKCVNGYYAYMGLNTSVTFIRKMINVSIPILLINKYIYVSNERIIYEMYAI
jgi:hypothetical protein